MDKIDNFNPAENGSDTYQIGNYHNYFDENMITTITPVTNSYVVKGYLLIHKPVSHLEEECKTLLLPVYITAFVIYLLSFSILAAFQFFVYRPLRKITEAAKQYASGNLEYEIPVNTQDEIGYLSASLNYMSTQLKDMDDYQKFSLSTYIHQRIFGSDGRRNNSSRNARQIFQDYFIRDRTFDRLNPGSSDAEPV